MKRARTVEMMSRVVEYKKAVKAARPYVSMEMNTRANLIRELEKDIIETMKMKLVAHDEQCAFTDEIERISGIDSRGHGIEIDGCIVRYMGLNTCSIIHSGSVFDTLHFDSTATKVQNKDLDKFEPMKAFFKWILPCTILNDTCMILYRMIGNPMEYVFHNYEEMDKESELIV